MALLVIWVWMVNYRMSSLYFILYLHVWIRIHFAPEHGSNTDPDPHGFIYTARSFFFKLPVITSQIYRARDPAKKKYFRNQLRWQEKINP